MWEKFKLWILSTHSSWFFLGYSIAWFLAMPNIFSFLTLLLFIWMVYTDR